ncbi:MAG: N-formylglutamate amidohydrolase [Robiginitomaculum sp.]|nr:MAG: N-formylglutamate amidohydrolase [Robiginitomaculum sp.]
MWNFKGLISPKGQLNNKERNKAEAQALAALSPAFFQILPKTIKTPILIACPHAGRQYPQAFLKQTQLSLDELRLAEDSHVDEIFEPLTESGFPFLKALFPRCYIDVNRADTDWPPESVPHASQHTLSLHAKSGLGVTPTRITKELNIYTYPLPAEHIQARLDALYHPYHNALKDMIENTKAQFGHAVLLDCHSMPGKHASGQSRADIILGDRFGKSCHPNTINILQTLLFDLGYNVVRNIPYAGGFVTTHYGQPDTGVEAIQIEINKDLYLNPHTFTPHDGMAKICADLQTAVKELQSRLLADNKIAAQ